jgi:hypothetical protein
MRKHDNDTPGDIAGGDAWNLPGGAGTYNPDNDVDAAVDEITDEAAFHGNTGRGFTRLDQQGDVAGDYATGTDSGMTVDPADLVEPEEEERAA